MISDISHQTRTPIANIKLYLELLEDEEFSQNGQEFLGKIKGQMEKLNFNAEHDKNVKARNGNSANT